MKVQLLVQPSLNAKALTWPDRSWVGAVTPKVQPSTVNAVILPGSRADTGPLCWEPPEEVILRRELVRTPGLQPEDLGVLAELLLRDPSLPSTMEAIRADLQARGWKMGKDRYNAIAKRLTAAGHLARVSVFDESTQRPSWVTRVYRNPANNSQYVQIFISALDGHSSNGSPVPARNPCRRCGAFLILLSAVSAACASS